MTGNDTNTKGTTMAAISISLCPTELEAGSDGYMYDETALLAAIRNFIAGRFGSTAKITALQVGFRQGDCWARIDGDDEAGRELLSDFFEQHSADDELFAPLTESTEDNDECD